MIGYVGTVGKKSTKKTLLVLISDYGKVAECKINIQKSIVFLYTNNKQMKLEMQRHLHEQPLKIKYLSISLTKHVQDLCEENKQRKTSNEQTPIKTK